jgi:hypothetical protein
MTLASASVDRSAEGNSDPPAEGHCGYGYAGLSWASSLLRWADFAKHRPMLLQLISPNLAPTWMESPHLRLSGGILSDGLSRNVIAMFSPDGWVGHDRLYKIIRFCNATRLLFGLPRDPVGWSGEIRDLALQGTAMWGGSARLAEYSRECDVWRAVMRPMWWHSVHLVAPAAFAPEASQPARDPQVTESSSERIFKDRVARRPRGVSLRRLS